MRNRTVHNTVQSHTGFITELHASETKQNYKCRLIKVALSTQKISPPSHDLLLDDNVTVRCVERS